MRRLLFASVVALTAFGFGPAVSEATACPMCKEANESDETNSLPKAYMYSILFMLSVPATLFTGFGVGFYRLSKKSPDPAVVSESESAADHSDEFPAS